MISEEIIPLSSSLPATQELGQFHLDSLDSELDEDSPTRAGASSAIGEDSDLQSFEGNDFPMIVWLRGDEAYFHEFELDAENVMKKLGIKRSRLTQISGKELRVGRVRIDRYIKPVYRSKDVTDYLNWTRSTATHLKSSSALTTAVESLQAQSTAITQIVHQASTKFLDDLDQAFEDKISKSLEQTMKGVSSDIQSSIESKFLPILQRLSESAVEQKNGLLDFLTMAQQKSLEIDQKASAIISHIEQSTLRLSELQNRVLTLSETQNALEEKIESSLSQLTAIAEQNKKTFKKSRVTQKPRTPAAQAESKLILKPFKNRDKSRFFKS